MGSAADLPLINFNFGNKKPDKKQLIVVGSVVSILIATLSQCTGISEHGIWDLLDEVQRKYFPKSIINELVIQNPNQLKRRIERDVTKAIDEVIPEYNHFIEESNKKYKPRYIDEENNENLCYTKECKSLAPPMRIVAPWVDIQN